MIGMTAGGMIGDATADSVAKLTAKGPSVEQLHAAEMQNEAAVKQLQAAKLQGAGLEPDKATYTFGTAQQFEDRLKVLGLETDKAGVALKNAYGRREAAADAAKQAADVLNAKIKNLKDNKVPSDLIAKQVKPLQEQFNKAKKNLEKAQAEFDAQFRKTPSVIQKSITDSLSALSFKSIETILADKIAGIQVKAPPTAFTLPNPNAIDPWVKPTAAPPPTFQWENKNPNNPADTFNWAKGGLGDAISSEMRMKPPGSDLVIANTSETVIPAAGGYGMKGFIDTIATGFSTVNNQYKSVVGGLQTMGAETAKMFTQQETVNEDRYGQTTSLLNKNQKDTDSRLLQINQNISALSTKMAEMSSMGGMFGGGMDLGSGYGSAGSQIAGALGSFIKQTGGAPGSIHEHPQHGGVKGRHAPGSYHYSGRAIDIGAYANEQAGVIARIKQFNAKMGVKPVEFLHAGNDPNHQDHVHVAYALGYDNGRMFTSLDAAQSWENSMVPGSVKVASITGNSAEGFGGETSVVNNITINQQPGQDADELASIVALKIGEAVADARAASIFV
jgi:predicted  nucleic acid-binding Zn-ribbon protein